MKFNIENIENFSINLSVINKDPDKPVIPLKMHNFSLDNRGLSLNNINKSKGLAKFMFEYNDHIIPYAIRIYLEKDGNISSPYNIYPDKLVNGVNYFWNNNGAFYISDTTISLYISHEYLKDYNFVNKNLTTKQYMSEYLIN